MKTGITTIALIVLAAPAAAQPPDALNEANELALKAAAAQVAACVVQVQTAGGTELIATGRGGTQFRKGVGPTTGLIVSPDGYIISSAFNFANKPAAIFVTVPGHKDRFVAKAVGNDL